MVTLMYKVGLKKAKTVFFENSENRQIFIDEKIVKEEKTCLLNGAGVNLEHFGVAEYPAENETTRFLFIGRVMKEKELMLVSLRTGWKTRRCDVMEIES